MVEMQSAGPCWLKQHIYLYRGSREWNGLIKLGSAQNYQGEGVIREEKKEERQIDYHVLMKHLRRAQAIWVAGCLSIQTLRAFSNGEQIGEILPLHILLLYSRSKTTKNRSC